MKYKLFFIISFFSIFNTNAQDKNIELPDVDVNIGSRDYSPFCLFITKDNKVIYKKDTISVFQIKEQLYDYSLIRLYTKKQIHIFADKNVKYSLIDSIKTEISSTNSSKYIVYRSNDINTGRKRNKAKGIKHKSPLSFFSFMPPEYLKTKKIVRQQDSILKEQYKLNPNLPPIPNDNDWVTFISTEKAVYSIQQDVIDEALENKINKCYSISNNGLIDEKGNNVEINEDKLQDILQNNNVVFLKYETDLIYDNYIRFIEILQELKPNFKNNRGYAEVIELSYQIQRLHKKAKIKLCN